MVRLTLWILALAAAVWAHRRRDPVRGEDVRPLLALFAGAVIAWRIADLVAPRGLGGASSYHALHALPALALWVATIGLVGIGARTRDRWIRGILLGIALLVATQAESNEGAIALTLGAIAGYRWREAFKTRALLRLTFAAIALLVVAAWRVPGAAPAPRIGPEAGVTTRALAEFGQWAHTSAIYYLSLGIVALFARVVRDPSLGIRRVSRRLALSHVLVVAVPLALVVMLWIAATVLGVSADRAAIARRAIESEADAMRTGMLAAIESPDPRAAFERWRNEHAERWPRVSAWTLEHDAWTRVAGDSVRGEARLRAWVDSLGRFPNQGLVMLVDSTYLGVAARDSAAPRVAFALLPATTFLVRTPSRLADASLHVVHGTVKRNTNGITFSSHDPETTGTAARDSAARTDTRGITISTDDQTFVAGPKGSSWLTTALSGYTVVPGVAWRDSVWANDGYLLAAAVPPSVALSGLQRIARDNEIGILPILMLIVLASVFLLVALFDLIMVTNMGRSITRAIHALRGGAARLESGDLGHRIQVEGEDDLWDVAAAFNTAAAGLERGRIVEQERNRFESELAVARQIQARLLPESAPEVPGLELAGHSESAREVGGDYYDHLDLGDGRALLVVADVSGKGVPAALLMSGFRASLLSQDLPRIEPTELMRRLNESVVRSVRPGRFVTAFIAFVDGRNGRVEYVNAGHNPPLVVRRGGDHDTLTEGGPLLGIQAGASFDRGESALAFGELLVLYTDGVTEGADASGDMWGEERLIETLRHRANEPCVAIVRSVAADVRAFEGATGPADDITLIAARRVEPA